jgi:hypothetical protein
MSLWLRDKSFTKTTYADSIRRCERYLVSSEHRVVHEAAPHLASYQHTSFFLVLGLLGQI